MVHKPVREVRTRQHLTMRIFRNLFGGNIDADVGKEKAAQMLIVEADAEKRVRIYPYDLITSNFFPFTWKIDEAWNPDSYLYTDKRYKSDLAPYFDENAKIVISDKKEDGFTVTFDQAKIDEEYINDYNIYIVDKNGVIVRNATIWSEFYFYDMPETLSISFDGLDKGEYTVKIYANSFWRNRSEKPLVSEIIAL